MAGEANDGNVGGRARAAGGDAKVAAAGGGGEMLEEEKKRLSRSAPDMRDGGLGGKESGPKRSMEVKLGV